jgi:16S rRNA (adenine1518-N6/adenine1519-N6)-dimethyltransferase
MLRQSLKGVVPDPGALLAGAGIDETRRAETLEIAEFLTLARLVAAS